MARISIDTVTRESRFGRLQNGVHSHPGTKIRAFCGLKHRNRHLPPYFAQWTSSAGPSPPPRGSKRKQVQPQFDLFLLYKWKSVLPKTPFQNSSRDMHKRQFYTICPRFSNATAFPDPARPRIFRGETRTIRRDRTLKPVFSHRRTLVNHNPSPNRSADVADPISPDSSSGGAARTYPSPVFLRAMTHLPTNCRHRYRIAPYQATRGFASWYPPDTIARLRRSH